MKKHFYAIAFALCFIILSSCKINLDEKNKDKSSFLEDKLSNIEVITKGDRILGNKDLVRKEFSIADYDKIELSSFYNIVYEQKESSSPSLEIEIDKNLLEYLEVVVDDGELNIKTANESAIKPSKFTVYTSSKNLKEISLRGAGNIKAENKVSVPELNIKLYGTGSIDFNDLEVDTIKCSVNGAGNIKLAGKGNSATLKVPGAGNINAKEFVLEDAEASVSGVGNIDVYATNRLKARVSGVGSIKYKGSPEDISTSKSGIGSIKQIK